MNIKTIKHAFGLCILLMTAGAHANDYDTGKRLFEQEAVDQAVAAWETAAKNGEVLAQRSLGMTLLIRRLPYFDPDNAVAWLIQAAEQGDARSAHWLALLYTAGKYVPQNLAAAQTYLNMAMDAGSTAARTLNGMWLEVGLTGEPNAREAVLNYHQAAQEGDTEGQYQLARCYALGVGLPPDNGAATYWLKEAARAGHKKALATLNSGEFRP